MPVGKVRRQYHKTPRECVLCAAMRNPFDAMHAALIELGKTNPLASGAYVLEDLGAGLYRLGVLDGDTLTPSKVIARPARMARALRAMTATA